MNTQRISAIDPATATGSNKKFFDLLQSSLGVIPNMTRTMAQSPAVLEAYVAMKGALSKGSLGRTLGEQLALTLAAANHCEYCASAHSMLAQKAGLSQDQVADALQGNASDPRSAAALEFARLVVEKRGQITDADFNTVRAAGFTEGQIGEIVAHVAVNTFTNYFNIVAGTENDFPRVELAQAA